MRFGISLYMVKTWGKYETFGQFTIVLQSKDIQSNSHELNVTQKSCGIFLSFCWRCHKFEPPILIYIQKRRKKKCGRSFDDIIRKILPFTFKVHEVDWSKYQTSPRQLRDYTTHNLVVDEVTFPKFILFGLNSKVRKVENWRNHLVENWQNHCNISWIIFDYFQSIQTYVV